MIPKVIHYCWFGRNPLPPLAIKCIASWRKYFPDYEIKEWNEDNFDVNMIPYTQEAYEARKYAFVSDYARFYVLYHYGGLYFDTDVEVIRPMDDIIKRGAFMGCENKAEQDVGTTVSTAVPGLGLGCNPGLGLGCNSGLSLYAEILGLYGGLNFKCADGGLNLKTVVEYTTKLLVDKGLKNVNEVQRVADIWVYPKDYFCPIDLDTGEIVLTKNSYSIHHYLGSWVPKRRKLGIWIKNLFGDKVLNIMLYIKRKIH